MLRYIFKHSPRNDVSESHVHVGTDEEGGGGGAVQVQVYLRGLALGWLQRSGQCHPVLSSQ